MTGRNENVVASSAMVQSLSMLIENKIVIQNNNLGLAFQRKMMLLSRNLR
jgi:hypothetical protein